MKKLLQHTSFALLAALLLAGCAAPRPDRRAAVSTEKPAPHKAPPTEAELRRMEEESARAAEPRAEGLARFALGLQNEMRGDRREALEQFFQSAMADVRNEALVVDVTRTLLAAKRFTMARELLVKASSETNAPAHFFAQLGWVYLQTGDTNEAIAANHIAIRRNPRELAPYQNLIAIHTQHNDPVASRAILDRAGTVTAPEALFLVDLADLYTRFARQFTNQTEHARAKSLELLARARASKPKAAGVILKIADGYNWHGDTKLAAEVYLEMLGEFAEQPELRDALRARLTDLYLRGKDRKKAAELLESIVKDNASNPQAHYTLGALAYEEKDYPRAIGHLERVVALAPDFEQGYHDLVGAQLSADRTDDALTTLREARARFARRAGGNFTIEYYTALAHTRRKDYVAALKSFTAAEVIARATETNRLTPFLYFQIGAAHERNKNYEDAETYFKKSLRLDDDFAEAHNYLGYMWAERGVHLEAAKRHIEDALRLEPKNGAYLDSLGWVLHKQGRHEEALRQLLDALKYTEKPDATLHDHLGDIHAALKQRDRAVAEWKRSLEIEPNDDVRRKLDAATASP